MVLFVRELGRDVAGAAGQPLPDLLPELVPPELADGGLHPGEKVFGGVLRPGDAEDGELLRQQVAERERV